jgi:predicted helicase
MSIETYLANITTLHKTGIAREHSYRGDLQTLLGSILKDLLVTNEPAHIECGAPDYILTRKGIPIGYVEAKDIGVNLADKKLKEQFDRYRNALNNLIITDYLTFQFYKDGELVTSIAIADFKDKNIVPKPDNFSEFISLIENFSHRITQSIKSPAHLAVMMAAKARLMSVVIESALHSDDETELNSGLKAQVSAFKDILIHDISNTAFADIYAQTICYGMFAARYHDPTLDNFSRQEAATLIPKSNPFLRNLFQYIAGYELDSRLVWIVDELVQIFNATDVAAIMRNFGKSTRQEDPVVHFYETFLGEYDPKLRKARGVWYTPEPVVNFIVRATDEIVKTCFNLPKGLSDTSKVKVMVDTGATDKKGQPIKVEKELHRLQILDPATGTGTFLVSVVRHIYDSCFATMQGIWPGYVKEHLIPRLNGFELLMTSYAMAHLKLDMLLSETGCKPGTNSTDRLKIYLTNSLEEHHPDTGTLFASWLSNEANEANHIKRDAPVMIVMGNPPYSVSSSNKSEWIQDLLQDYKVGLNERNIQPLSDDYIKFIRFGQHYVDKNGEGLLAYISNNSFIDGIIHRKMRQSLLESFDQIYILDLHGNSKKKESAPDGGKDENVFDIMQGVSINLFIKSGKKPKGELAQLFHHQLYGKRDVKYEALNQGSLANIPWQKLEPKAPEFFFVPKDFGVEVEYKKGFRLEEIFLKNVSGVETKRDSLFIDYDKKQLADRISSLLNGQFSRQEEERLNIKDSSSYLLTSKINKSKYCSTHIIKCNYRVFDDRYIYYDKDLLGRPFYSVMRHLLNKNHGLIVSKQQSSSDFQHCFMTNMITDRNSISLQTREASYLFPLYLYPDTPDLVTGTDRTPNLNMAIVGKIAGELGLTFVAEEPNPLPNPPPLGEGTKSFISGSTPPPSGGRLGGGSTFTPLDLLDYIYAVLHTPHYRETYKEFLKIDFPRVPYPCDVTEFWRLVDLGGELRQIHLLETKPTQLCMFPAIGTNIVTKPHFEENRVYINSDQYFENVPQTAWQFYIGGYQPAQKWLKDRSGRTLDYEDIGHYQKIIAALQETARIMEEL